MAAFKDENLKKEIKKGKKWLILLVRFEKYCMNIFTFIQNYYKCKTYIHVFGNK